MLPYRECDIFDEVCTTISSTFFEESSNPDKIIENIRYVANQLLQNEQIPNKSNSLISDSEDMSGILQNLRHPLPCLQIPDTTRVEQHVEETRKKLVESTSSNGFVDHSSQLRKPKKVSVGPKFNSLDSSMPVSFSRRLDVVKICVGHIFNNRIAEARRLLPASMRALKLIEVRRRLPAELSRFAFEGDKQEVIVAPVLNSHQFDLVVQIVVFTLSLESHWDENGIAAAILPLSTIFYRYLGDSRHQQFLYTAIQDHPVWLNQNFWASCIYRHVAAAVAAVHCEDKTPNVSKEPPFSLEVCANYLEQTKREPNENLELNSREEESMAYSYCKHFANLMVYMLTPLDPNRDLSGLLSQGNSNSFGDYNAGNGSIQAGDSSAYSESGFDEQDLRDVRSVVHWFISRVLQNVCGETGVSEDHRKNLEAILGETVGSHMDYLEMVYQHTRHLPPLQKPRILEPNLLQGEQKIIGPLRAIVLPDGRRLGVNGDRWIGQMPHSSKTAMSSMYNQPRKLTQSGAVSDITSVATGTAGGDLDDSGSSDHAICLLPAEGAIFLTTYRLVFIGNPIDSFASETIIRRSIPVASLWSEKQVSAVYLHHPYDHNFTQCYQMRSNTFEIMKILFDSSEVSESAIVDLRQQLNELRYPPEITSLFCARQLFNTDTMDGDVSSLPPSVTLTPVDSRKQNTHSKSKLKTLAKSTLSKLNVGSNVQMSLERRFARTNQILQRQLQAGTVRASQRSSTLSTTSLQSVTLGNFANQTRANLLINDYERLKLGNTSTRSDLASVIGSSGWRLSLVNRQFLTCHSYPEILSTAVTVSDETLRRLAQNSKMQRFPCASWRHNGNGAVLMRSAAFVSSSNRVLTAIKRQTNSDTPNKDDSFSTSSSASVSLSSDLTNFVNSILQLGQGTKVQIKASSTPQTPGKQRKVENVSLCIVTDSTQVKLLKGIINDPSVDFIAVQTISPAQVKASYKRLLQKAVCPADAGERRKREMFQNSSSGNSSFNASVIGDSGTSGEGFLKAFSDSNWLQQVSTLLRIASMVAVLIDGVGSNVVVAAEDGSDFVTQVVSLCQILLDPFYRTRQGFKTLVIREWLAFGHRFGQRGGQMAANRLSSYIPVFLQFLDAVSIFEY